MEQRSITKSSLLTGIHPFRSPGPGGIAGGYKSKSRCFYTGPGLYKRGSIVWPIYPTTQELLTGLYRLNAAGPHNSLRCYQQIRLWGKGICGG